MRTTMAQIRAIRPLVGLALLLLIGCSPVSISTSTAPGADFATLHTYAWEPNPQMGGTLDDSIAGQEIHAAVNQALEARGFRPTAGQPPDLLVDYHVILQRQTQIEGVAAGAGCRPTTTRRAR